MYCKYWNLKKAPFDNVPDPTMYAACHASMENAISEIIFAIKEADESFAVIISDAGLGKTLALRRIINAIDPDKFRSVLITNPSLSFTQLLREIIVQITGKPCEEVQKGVLLDMLRNLLAASMDQGKKIVIFIDEANALTPSNLEDLRLLTNIQDENRNLLTLVLAGQLELAQRLEHPQQANLFQRIGAYARIGKLSSIESVKLYIEDRLKLAGTNIKIFADDCIPVIWEYSEHGVPRLINKICKLCLKAGETNQFDYISADIVAQVAGRFQKLTDTASAQIPPVHTPPIIVQEENETPSNVQEIETPAQAQEIETPVHAEEIETPAPTQEDQASSNTAAEGPVETEISIIDGPAMNATGEETGKLIQFPVPANYETADEKMATDAADIKTESSETASGQISDNDLLKQWEEAISQPSDTAVISAVMEQEMEPQTSDDSTVPEKSVPETNDSPSEKDATPAEMESPALENLDKTSEEPSSQVSPVEPPKDVDSDIIMIGEYRVKLGIPKEILKQVKSFNRESANKSAGFWAAQIIKNNPELSRSAQADPVHLWNEIKDNILKKIAL